METEIGNYSLRKSIILIIKKKMNSEDKEVNEIKKENENEISNEVKKDNNLKEIKNYYQFGWSNYSEITNGRFAMIGFLALILIEFFSNQSFLKWAGLL